MQSREELLSDSHVDRWISNTTDDGEPADHLKHRVDVLADFVDSIGKTPTELVAFCFLRKRDSGDRFVSTKRRTAVNEQIEAFVVERGWTGKEAVVNGNIVRSFLIHNGIPIGAKTWTGRR